MNFHELLTESERTGYMLGPNAARSGETPRGFAQQSVYSNLGFYKRNPEDDVKKHPTSPVPEGVLATIKTIIDCFLYIHKIDKSKAILGLLLPYIYNFEELRTTIVRYSKANESLEQARKRLEKLQADHADDPEQSTADQLGEQEEAVVGLEELVHKLETKISELSNILEEERVTIYDDFIERITTLCKNNTELGSAQHIKEAFDRYMSLVYGRREEVRKGMNRSYLLLDPIVSLMRFYNNTLLQYKKLSDKIVNVNTAKDILSGIHGLPSAKMLNLLIDCIDKIVRLRRKSSQNDKSAVIKKYKEYAEKSYSSLIGSLRPETKKHLGVYLQRFLKNEPMSEGNLRRFLLLDVQKELQMIK